MSDSDSDVSLRLTLSPPGSRSHTPLHNQQPAYSDESERVGSSSSSSRRGASAAAAAASRRGTAGSSRPPKEDSIAPPYPWATDRRGVVHTLDWMIANGIARVYGEVSCKNCGSHVVEVDVASSFYRLSNYFLANRDAMRDRAPRQWTAPQLLTCQVCQQGEQVRPTVSAKKRSINWLFLLLTETLGICTLEQLKYFCKHTRRHRTGAKDRVLYLTYAALLKQLNPAGPYH